jgi:predicted alpha/beta hydrolase family esterase
MKILFILTVILVAGCQSTYKIKMPEHNVKFRDIPRFEPESPTDSVVWSVTNHEMASIDAVNKLCKEWGMKINVGACMTIIDGENHIAYVTRDSLGKYHEESHIKFGSWHR